MNRYGKLLRNSKELKKYLDKGYKMKEIGNRILVYKESPVKLSDS